MEQNASRLSDEEVTARIIHMHDNLKLGYRKIAEELNKKGYVINKDRVNKLYLKSRENSGNTAQSEDKELIRLGKFETAALKRYEKKREKERIHRQLATLFVEEYTMTFKQRKKLFTDRDKLLKFAKKVMPVFDAMLWDEFVEFFEERGYDLKDKLAKSLGDQRDFEVQPANSSLKRFDVYLRSKISDCLTFYRKREQSWKGEGEKTDQEPASDATEIISFERPDDFF